MIKYKSILIFSMTLTSMLMFFHGFIYADDSLNEREVWLKKIAPSVKQTAKKYNIYGSVVMAQAALESDFGQSGLSTSANNFFGIKGSGDAGSVIALTSEYNDGTNGNPWFYKTFSQLGITKNTTDIFGNKVTNTTVKIPVGEYANVFALFAKYKSFASSLDYNGSLIRNGLSWGPAYYAGAWKENTKSYQDAAKALQGTYATDSTYASKLISLIQEYDMQELADTLYAGSYKASSLGTYNKDMYVTKSVTAWTNLNFTAKKSTLKSGRGTTYVVKYRYSHTNGSTYGSLYLNGVWQGYVNMKALAGQPVKVNTVVTVKNEAPTWTSTSFSHQKATVNVGQTYRAKYYTEHGNGSTYTSLYDLKKGAFVGYVNEKSISKPAGSYKATALGKDNRVMYLTKSVTAWKDLDFKTVKTSSPVTGRATSYTVKYTYQHTNGSIYGSLYLGQTWIGYVNVKALSEQPIAISKVATVTQNAPTWTNMSFSHQQGTVSAGQTYIAKYTTKHGNGSTYVSLYNRGNGTFAGYVNAISVRLK